MNKSKILIVDDDIDVLNMLGKVMQSYEYNTKTALSGEAALEMLNHELFDLLLLDINMPGIDGFSVIKTLREQGKHIPIIVISARREEYDTLFGLGLGADDYITKPFNPVILGAKVKALLRRCDIEDNKNSVIKAGEFTYDTHSLRLYKDGVEIPLTGKENTMMKLFIDNVGKTFSNEMLYELIWNNDIVDNNTIMVYIKRLRDKIEIDSAHPKYIQNIRGIDYRFVIQ